jgi:leader peptidase (prepilin peptidase)/N-methyltransferase
MVAGVVLVWLGALSAYDMRQRRLPNWLTLPGAAVLVLGGAAAGRAVPALAGGAALAGLYLAVHLATPSAMGAGDVKLALGLGALTGSFGVEVWFLAALGAPMFTALIGTIARLGRSAEMSTQALPHGPSMCLASAAAVAVALSIGS